MELIVWLDGGGSWPASCPDSTSDLTLGQLPSDPTALRENSDEADPRPRV
jgi:hypothetical protein